MMVARQTENQITGSSEFVNQASLEVADNSPVLVQSGAEIRSQLIEKVAKDTLASLDNFEDIVGEAKQHMADRGIEMRL